MHKPALAFERFFRRFNTLVCETGLKLPPKDFRSVVLVSMLFVDHEQEIMSVKPPHNAMRVLAFIGRLIGYKLPQ